MPELPDVEGFRRVLAEHVGQTVRRVEVLDAQVVRDQSARRFAEGVRGRRIDQPRRHGKWLIAPLSGGSPVLVLHFGMTGALIWARSTARSDHDRVVFHLPGGELRFRDQRKLQGLRLLADEQEVARLLSPLGPDAETVSRQELTATLVGRHRQVKSLLTDQHVLAGVGNLMADEILWRARIHPRRRDLTEPDADRLHKRMSTVIRQAVPTGRVPPRKSWLTGRRDEPAATCPRCGTPLTRSRIAGRGTVWCPHCQPN